MCSEKVDSDTEKLKHPAGILCLARYWHAIGKSKEKAHPVPAHDIVKTGSRAFEFVDYLQDTELLSHAITRALQTRSPMAWVAPLALGEFSGGYLRCPQLGLDVRLEPSDVIFLRGRVVRHQIKDWNEGQRAKLFARIFAFSTLGNSKLLTVSLVYEKFNPYPCYPFWSFLPHLGKSGTFKQLAPMFWVLETPMLSSQNKIINLFWLAWARLPVQLPGTLTCSNDPCLGVI
ncbi:hypothetical protein EDD15DRAFT_2199065 [Pisolithus albus]|nr:hypothetical protein EDD15DRAFT_2199065 [Pisolithus albus]